MTATDTPAADPSTNGGSQHRGFGIDVGGSGVKGGIVDLDTGQLIGERFKLLTPQPATPDAVSKTIAEVVRHFGWTDKIGVTYPGVVTNGVIRTAVGLMLVAYPHAGAEAMTLVLCFYFVVGGIFKMFASTVLKFPSWGWSVASGAISIVLGVALLLQWPQASFWFIGFAVGVDLMLYGWALLMFASAMKKLSPSDS